MRAADQNMAAYNHPFFLFFIMSPDFGSHSGEYQKSSLRETAFIIEKEWHEVLPAQVRFQYKAAHLQ